MKGALTAAAAAGVAAATASATASVGADAVADAGASAGGDVSVSAGVSGATTRASAVLLQRNADSTSFTAHPLTAWTTLAATRVAAAGGGSGGVGDNKMIVCVADPSPDQTKFGWPLRNLLVLLSHQFGSKGIALTITVVRWCCSFC
jgi:hypothetical protein